jgi:hypothetical protein
MPALKGKKVIHKLLDFIYGKHPHKTIFSWNYLFTRVNIKWAKKYSKEFKSKIVVDYGCGNLPYYSYFEPYIETYYALDFRFSGNKKEKVEYITLNDNGSIPAAPDHDLKKCDLILSFQVCNELENLDYYFSEIIKIIGGNTKILLTTIFGLASLGHNDKIRVSPYCISRILQNMGLKILIYEPGGFFFAGIAVSLNLLLISKNKYDYNSPEINTSKIKCFLFTPIIFIINLLTLFFDFIFPLKRSPCQYLIIAEKA